MTRAVLLGRILWGLVPVAYFGLQWFVASAWPVPYDLLHHTISDLGWTTCTVEQRPGGTLESCSPRHAWFNVGGIVLWVLPRPRSRRAVVILWWVVAAFGVATCVVPGDVDITAHSLLAVPIFLGTIERLAGETVYLWSFLVALLPADHR